MDKQQSYSHGLLYSVAPEYLFSLHLLDEEGMDDFDWQEYESQFKGDSLAQVVLNFLRITAVKWGITKLH